MPAMRDAQESAHNRGGAAVGRHYRSERCASTRAIFPMANPIRCAVMAAYEEKQTMAKDFQLIHLKIDEEHLKSASNRVRNQFVGCMHAHNELTILNRLLMFAMNDTGDGELHDSAQSVQMWCLLQILAAKLVETWDMLNERFLKAKPDDPALGCLWVRSRVPSDQTHSILYRKRVMIETDYGTARRPRP